MFCLFWASAGRVSNHLATKDNECVLRFQSTTINNRKNRKIVYSTRRTIAKNKGTDPGWVSRPGGGACGNGVPSVEG